MGARKTRAREGDTRGVCVSPSRAPVFSCAQDDRSSPPVRRQSDFWCIISAVRKTANVMIFFRNHRWALCPHGYFLQGFYRTNGQCLYNIENGQCCRPNNLPNEYRHCYDKDVLHSFDHKGWNRCRDGYYMVGLYRGSCHHLYCIEKFKCCSMIVGEY